MRSATPITDESSVTSDNETDVSEEDTLELAKSLLESKGLSEYTKGPTTIVNTKEYEAIKSRAEAWANVSNLVQAVEATTGADLPDKSSRCEPPPTIHGPGRIPAPPSSTAPQLQPYDAISRANLAKGYRTLDFFLNKMGDLKLSEVTFGDCIARFIPPCLRDLMMIRPRASEDLQRTLVD